MEGSDVGWPVGCEDGRVEGSDVGCVEGCEEGSSVGPAVGIRSLTDQKKMICENRKFQKHEMQRNLGDMPCLLTLEVEACYIVRREGSTPDKKLINRADQAIMRRKVNTSANVEVIR